jgi:hypothetical protein
LSTVGLKSNPLKLPERIEGVWSKLFPLGHRDRRARVQSVDDSVTPERVQVARGGAEVDPLDRDHRRKAGDGLRAQLARIGGAEPEQVSPGVGRVEDAAVAALATIVVALAAVGERSERHRERQEREEHDAAAEGAGEVH